MNGLTGERMKQLIRTRAELTEAYEGLQQEIFRLDTLHELVGDALARVKSLQWEEANKLERLVGADTSAE